MKKIIKISTAICGALLAVLGFSALMSCGGKYGMPPEYNISGIVIDKITGKPIKDIEVTNHDDKNVGRTVSTGNNGYYSIHTQKVLRYLSFRDVDGEENGLYNDTTVFVEDASFTEFALTPKK